MRTHCFRSALAAAAVATTLSCGDERMILEPGLGKGGASTPLRVTPRRLPFVIPPAVPATITATVQYVGQIMARTSDPACATVAPTSVPATKPPGSSVYVATFTVTPVAEGACTITLTDKKGQQVEVEVSVASGGRIAFISTRDGNAEIYTVRPDGSQLTRLTTTAEHEAEPAFSPDGRQIAFWSSDGTTTHVYLMDADGGNRKLVPGTANGGTPAFSRDGQRLVFELYYEDTGNRELASINLDGSGLQRLTTAPGLNEFSLSPTVAPSGRIVTYAQRLSDLPPGLFILDSDGSNWARLTGDTQRAHLPATPDFSPDGSRIVFQ
jgi:Tol biopolymer transport system component